MINALLKCFLIFIMNLALGLGLIWGTIGIGIYRYHLSAPALFALNGMLLPLWALILWCATRYAIYKAFGV